MSTSDEDEGGGTSAVGVFVMLVVCVLPIILGVWWLRSPQLKLLLWKK